MLSNQSQAETHPAKHKRKIVARKFAAEYMANGQNGKKAYLAIKPNVSEGTAVVQASRMLDKPNVQSEIAKLMPSDAMISEQITSAITQQPDNNISWSEKHNYITTALKLKGYLKDKQQGDVNVALIID